jgi:hypothetical protein
MALFQTRGRGEHRLHSLVGAHILAAHLVIKSEGPEPNEDPSDEDPSDEEPDEDVDDDG